MDLSWSGKGRHILIAGLCGVHLVAGLNAQLPLGTPAAEALRGSSSCDYGCDNISIATPDLEEYIEGVMKRWHTPGLAIALVDGNKTWAKGFGEAIRGSEPVTPSTLFYCGSTTKSFTAAAISLLVDEAENYSSIAWDSPVVKFLREDFQLEENWSTLHVTIEDALSHRTGYPRHDLARAPSSPSDLASNFRNLPMTAEPRTKFQYSNLMFCVMGNLVSKLTGSWLGDVFRERLWHPMGMKTTFLSLSDAKESGLTLADEHFYNNDTGLYETLSHASFPLCAGAGMTISNVLDYSRYLRAMMTEAPPISKAGHSALKTGRTVHPRNQYPAFTGPTVYSLGWDGGVLAGAEVWHHAGQVNGHISFMGYLPGRQVAAIVIVNSITSVAVESVWYRVLYDFLGVEADKRYDVEKKSAASLKNADDFLKTARERLYPAIPDPPVKMPVPLEKYVGKYHDAGYGTVEVKLDCSERKYPKDSPASATTDQKGCRLIAQSAVMPGMEGQAYRMDLEHISGDFWLGWAYTVILDYRRPDACQRVQFRVGADGTVASVGADVRIEGESVPLTWFTRVED